MANDNQNTEQEESLILIVNREYKEWTVNATKIIIDLFKKYRNKVGTTSMKKRKNLWEQISSEMKSSGYDYSPLNCENRWKVLERNFKKFVDDQSQTGRGKKIFEFYEDMRDIYEKKRNVYPHILLTSRTEILSSDNQPGISSTSVASSSTPLSGIPSTSGLSLPTQLSDVLLTTPQSSKSTNQQDKNATQKNRKRKRTAQKSALQDMNTNLKEYHTKKIEYYNARKNYYKKKVINDGKLVNELTRIGDALGTLAQTLSDRPHSSL